MNTHDTNTYEPDPFTTADGAQSAGHPSDTTMARGWRPHGRIDRRGRRGLVVFTAAAILSTALSACAPDDPGGRADNESVAPESPLETPLEPAPETETAPPPPPETETAPPETEAPPPLQTETPPPPPAPPADLVGRWNGGPGDSSDWYLTIHEDGSWTLVNDYLGWTDSGTVDTSGRVFEMYNSTGDAAVVEAAGINGCDWSIDHLAGFTTLSFCDGPTGPLSTWLPA